jgi:hypothetical protein
MCNYFCSNKFPNDDFPPRVQVGNDYQPHLLLHLYTPTTSPTGPSRQLLRQFQTQRPLQLFQLQQLPHLFCFESNVVTSISSPTSSPSSAPTSLPSGPTASPSVSSQQCRQLFQSKCPLKASRWRLSCTGF